LAELAAKIEYGEMSPKMKAAQDAEVLAIRRRQAEVWGTFLIEPPWSRGELACAYMGFPF
jgi:hypothetical protein